MFYSPSAATDRPHVRCWVENRPSSGVMLDGAFAPKAVIPASVNGRRGSIAKLPFAARGIRLRPSGAFLASISHNMFKGPLPLKLKGWRRTMWKFPFIGLLSAVVAMPATYAPATTAVFDARREPYGRGEQWSRYGYMGDGE